MAKNAIFQHFSDPVVSLFQSAAAAVDARERTGTPAAPSLATLPPVDHAAPMLQATAGAARALTGDQDVLGTVDVCAQAYLKLAIARARGDEAAIAAAQEALPPFGICDKKWSETLVEFLLHYGLVKHG
ncbi:MAG: hypothetical protein JO209_08005, partial [Acidisphaera sp.]|nr:hypothetical protein [Acidisphaera sp.]